MTALVQFGHSAPTARLLFTGRLREQIDLDVLCRVLVGVAADMVHATLWLRPSDQDV